MERRFIIYTIHIAWKYFKTLLILWNFVSFNFVSKYFSPLRKYPFPKRSFINVSSFEPLTLPPPIRFQIWAECYPLYTTNGPKQKTSISTVIQINKAVGLLETPYNTYVKGFKFIVHKQVGNLHSIHELLTPDLKAIIWQLVTLFYLFMYVNCTIVYVWDKKFPGGYCCLIFKLYFSHHT